MPPPATCPNCGGQIHLLTGLSADSAPWLCDNCGRAWWSSELTIRARASWDHVRRDWGNNTINVMADAHAERDAAVDKVKGKK